LTLNPGWDEKEYKNDFYNEYFTLQYNKGSVSQIIPDTIAILIVVGLLFLGIRVKSNVADEK
jgi:hypothetical protein